MYQQFSLSEEQKEFARSMLEFAKAHVAPYSVEIDEKSLFHRGIVKKFADAGLFGLVIPKEYGGMGCSLFDACLAKEQFGRVDNSAALWFGVNAGGLLPILLGGNEKQKAEYLPKIASGEFIAGVGFTEPEAGSDLMSLKTTAVRRNEFYEINGRKCFISNAGMASVYSLLARTGPEKNGISCFILDASNPGLSIGKIERKMGVRGSPTGELILENCMIPDGKLLGREGDGLELAMGMLIYTRTLVSAQGVGLASGALDYTLDYVRKNKGLFSKYHGIVEYELANMAIHIESARQLVYRTAAMADAGDKDAFMLSSMAKCHASDIAMEVTQKAMDIFGFCGYTTELPIERFMRDAKAFQVFEGTNQIQRLTIAKEMFAKG